MSCGSSLHRTVSINGNPETVRGLRQMLSSYLRDRSVDEQTARGVVLAFSEALDNAVEHGIEQGDGRIEVRLRFSPRFVLVSLRDSGSDRTPLGVAVPASDDAERGRGFQLMHSLMDRVKVRSFPDGGTRVTMLRRLDRAR